MQIAVGTERGAVMASESRRVVWIAAFCLFYALCGSAQSNDTRGAEPSRLEPSRLEHGFTSLYNLDFSAAQQDFAAWEQTHPDDPVGPVSEAAGLLFSEFNRMGILEAQFFENDKAFLDRPKLAPDPTIHSEFEASINRAADLAHLRLAKDPADRDGLFALTLCFGLQADYAALIEKKNMASLRFTKEASASGQQLLAVCHDCYDALLATGFSKYVIGSMPAPIRWVLSLGGLPSDKQGGIADLQTTAAHGHYLAPFARILLAIAYVREKDKARALQLLNVLHDEFPGNKLFSREISRLQSGS